MSLPAYLPSQTDRHRRAVTYCGTITEPYRKSLPACLLTKAVRAVGGGAVTPNFVFDRLCTTLTSTTRYTISVCYKSTANDDSYARWANETRVA